MSAAAKLSRAVVVLALGIQLLACQHKPAQPVHVSLPSRPTWEMYPRASSPPSDCPGQYRTVIQDMNGDLFLGCWGQKTATTP